jgi:hypothetical protein
MMICTWTFYSYEELDGPGVLTVVYGDFVGWPSYSWRRWY